jgi:acetyl-CoA carboxylase carboxyl transferase subunit beta
LDEEGQTEIAPNLVAVDPLKFKDQKKYKERIIQAQKTTNEGTCSTSLLECSF